MSAFLSSLLPLLKKLAPYLWYGALFLLGRQRGRQAATNEQNVQNMHRLKNMAQAEADKPTTKEAIIERLNKGEA